MNSVFNFKKFDLNNIADHAAICCVAARRKGKSILVRDILLHKKDYPAGVVIAPTDKLSGFYNEFFPPSFIHYEYSSELLSKIFLRQSLLIEKNKERKARGKPLIDTRLFLIMDDCLAQKGLWAKDPNILELLQNGRHYHITFILTMQYSLGISPELRGNFDYVFLLGEDFISNQKRLYEHYAGMFPTFDIFKRAFTKITDSYGVMVITKDSGTNVTDKVYWYKVNMKNMTKRFTLGSKMFKDFNERYYNENWNKIRKVFDVDEYLNKKNKLNIDINLQKN